MSKIPFKKPVPMQTAPSRRVEDIVPQVDVPVDIGWSSVRVMGIDYSLSATGFVVLDGSGNVLFKATKGSSLTKDATLEAKVRRCIQNAQAVIGAAKSMRVTHIAIEGSLYKGSSGHHSSYGLEDVAGGRWVLLSQLLLALNSVPAEFTPSSARKIVLGNGNTPKDQVRGLVHRRYGILFQDHNQADAFVVARALYEVLKRNESNKPKPKQETLF